MELDITGKVGIENALELLEEKLEIAEKQDVSQNAYADMYKSGLILGLETAIEIVKLNITNK